LIESIVWLLSAALDTSTFQNGSETILNTIYLTSDCIALVTILVLFFPSVTALVEKATESSQPESSKKSRIAEGSSPRLFSHGQKRSMLTRDNSSLIELDLKTSNELDANTDNHSQYAVPPAPASPTQLDSPRSPTQFDPPSPTSQSDGDGIAPPSPRGPVARPAWISNVPQHPASK